MNFNLHLISVLFIGLVFVSWLASLSRSTHNKVIIFDLTIIFNNQKTKRERYSVENSRHGENNNLYISFFCCYLLDIVVLFCFVNLTRRFTVDTDLWPRPQTPTQHRQSANPQAPSPPFPNCYYKAVARFTKMGGTTSIQTFNNETIDLNDYKCSDRGLILPSKSIYQNLLNK